LCGTVYKLHGHQALLAPCEPACAAPLGSGPAALSCRLISARFAGHYKLSNLAVRSPKRHPLCDKMHLSSAWYKGCVRIPLILVAHPSSHPTCASHGQSGQAQAPSQGTAPGAPAPPPARAPRARRPPPSCAPLPQPPRAPPDASYAHNRILHTIAVLSPAQLLSSSGKSRACKVPMQDPQAPGKHTTCLSDLSDYCCCLCWHAGARLRVVTRSCHLKCGHQVTSSD